ncbi:MAG: beta-ketoacyl synthase N-terminal-like domain-containing protein [Pseudomonadota bacterium]
MHRFEPIAVVSMGCAFPGAPGIATFWSRIVSGADAAGPVPPHRWPVPSASVVSSGFTPDRALSDQACLVTDLTVDFEGLALAPDLLRGLDPLYHLIIHAAREAAAGCCLSPTVSPMRISTILAAIALPTDGSNRLNRRTVGRAYRRAMPDGTATAPDGPITASDALAARVTSLPAALVAACFGWTGGSLTLDAACASSLYAIKLACDELHAHRADAVVTGGVSRPDCLYTQVGFSQLRALSPSGRCAPFSQNANGLVVGEGAGVLVLKRLADAVAHNDTVVGVIRGIGLSNDMRGNLLAPDSEGQLRAMRRAYELAGWQPEDVDHIECHGAGTPVGDATELNSLAQLWADRPFTTGQCAIGSVKSMIGHLLTAAGAAGMIKSLLAIHHQMLPPSLKADPPAEHPALTKGPFRVMSVAAPWPRRHAGRPLRAAVSAFGFGGINAHLLIEQWFPAGAAISPVNSAVSSMHAAPEAPVAIIGLAARFGAAHSADALLRMRHDNESPLRAAPTDRWYGIAETVAAEHAIALPRGGYMASVHIPAGKYRIPPTELPDILAQHLLMLAVAADAITDAGLPLRAERPRMGGVIGIDFDMEATDFHLRWLAGAGTHPWRPNPADPGAPWDSALADAVHPPLTAPRTLGALGGIIASRIAREFGFGGPSFVVSADAASGCRAVEIGVRSLQQMETDLFLAGAVDLAGDIRRLVMDGPFLGYRPPADAPAGPLPGDGAAAVILKRLDDALSDGDPIYGVITGIGKAGGGTIWPHQPSPDVYAHSLGMALSDAGCSPRDVVLWEIHGSGARSENTAESAALQAISTALPTDTPAGRMRVHSTTAQAGHCGAAAGLLSLATAALSLRHRRLPGSAATIPTEDAFRLPVPFRWATGESLPPNVDAGAAPPVALVAAITKDGNVMHLVLAPGPEAPATSVLRDDDDDHGKRRGFTRKLGKIPFQSPGAAPIAAGIPKTAAIQQPSPETAPQTLFRPHEAPSAMSHPVADTFRMAADTVAAGSAAVADAHQQFLDFSRQVTDAFAAAVTLQGQLLETVAATGLNSLASLPPAAAAPTPVCTREQCLSFAVGTAASVLGPDFADVDRYRTRVRLPGEPLMLVDRIMALEGEKDGLGAGRVVTEHDVHPGAWYLDGSRAPVSISVEAGQADLFLCAWLGIDHRVRGHRSYRLLDATVTFHRDLPQPGDIIRYDIHIDKFIKQQDTYLFFFRFEGHIGERHLITMSDGCAGFFTPEEVHRSGGIILTEDEKAPAAGISRVDWMPPVPTADVERYDDQAVDALRAGRLEDCFGEAFRAVPIAQGLRLPGGRMRLIDRIRLLDPAGGQYGLGRIEAEADVAPDAWFLTCHFVDDMTMPGTLMYDCCAHALRVLLQRLGWVSDAPDAHYAPVVGRPAALRCRGPVTPETRQVIYAVDIKEIGYAPEPYVIADAHMFADGRYIVMFRDMSLRMAGVAKADIQAIWQRRSVSADMSAGAPERLPLYDYERILAFCVGNPSAAFGAPYRVFDSDRRIARLPGPPYLFMDRVTSVAPPPWILAPGGWITAEYDIRGDAWYFRASRSGQMPFCVLLEIALQPCGWLAAYCGSALKSTTDLKFRNLGGDATLHRNLSTRAHRLTMKARLTKVSEAGEMIIEHFDFQVLDDEGPVYTGTTYFGFFTAAALANQVGFKKVTAFMDGARTDTPMTAGAKPLAHRAPVSPEDMRVDAPSGLCLPGKALLMIDAVDVADACGGPDRLGYLRARKTVDPAEWFFAAHFYQDPVCPGSLGVESFLQTLRLQARDRWPALARTHRFDMVPGHRHQWAYRGQVIPNNTEIVVESAVSAIDTAADPTLYGHGFLWCDGRCIYEMTNFGIRLVPIKTDS